MNHSNNKDDKLKYIFTKHCVFCAWTLQILTLVKTCEPVAEMRTCRSPRDWSLLALQNVRTGKSHYLVICRCPHTNLLGMIIIWDNIVNIQKITVVVLVVSDQTSKFQKKNHYIGTIQQRFSSFLYRAYHPHN